MKRWHWWLAWQVLRGRVVYTTFEHPQDRLTIGIDTHARTKRELARMRKEVRSVGR